MITENLLLVARATLDIFAEMAPYLLLGFLLSGILYVLVPKSSIRKALGGGGAKPILKAALIGIPLPLCSCGAVPMALSLRKQGASRGATLSFLVSTPETGMDAILITYGLLGPVMMIVRPIAAFVTAVACGLVQEWAPSTPDHAAAAPDDSCVVCNDENGDNHQHTAGEKAGRVFHYAFIEFLEDTAKWLVIGIVLAGIIGAFLTPEFVSKRLASPLLQMGLMLLVGIPMYTCASASTPVAAAFVAAGFSPGAALVYLLVGPATNATTLTMLARFLGTRSAVLYLVSISVVSVGLGIALDALIRTFGWSVAPVHAGVAESAGGIVQIVAALILGVLLLLSIVRGIARRHEHSHAH